MKSAFKNHFDITKKEWNGMVVLMIIIFLVLITPYGFQYFHKDEVMNLKEFNKYVKQLELAKDKQSDNQESSNIIINNQHRASQRFVFNPNNLPPEQWKKLGLSEPQISVIKNYESKGGHFYKKKDVQKIYSITANDYKRLEPYIDLPGGEVSGEKSETMIEINGADSATLTTIRGIGASFAVRIIKYRKQLGGFYKKQQLKEIYGLDSVKYAEIQKQICINKTKIVKLHINSVLIDDLRRFPYLDFKQMNAIIQYRKQHGNYQSLNDLHNIAILDDEILRKIEPYLSFK